MFGKFTLRSTDNKNTVSHVVNGLDDSVVTFVLNRTPSAKELKTNNECISYYAVNGEIGVISQTIFVASSVFGAPGSSRTSVIHFSPEELGAFANNPGLLAYVLASNGSFADTDDSAANLAAISLMPSFIFDAVSWRQEFDRPMLKQIDRALDIHDQVVLSCESNPYKLVSGLYARMEDRKRWDRSFTFGSLASGDRPFNLQIFEQFDVQTQSFLLDNQIRYFEIGMGNSLVS